MDTVMFTYSELKMPVYVQQVSHAQQEQLRQLLALLEHTNQTRVKQLVYLVLVATSVMRLE
jgi:hypothetical protein